MPAFPLKFCLRSSLLPAPSPLLSQSVCQSPVSQPAPPPLHAPRALAFCRSGMRERGALRSPDWTTRLFVVLRRESECGSKSDKSRQLQMPQQGSATLPVGGIWTVCHKWPFKDRSVIVCSDSYLRLHCTSKHCYCKHDTSSSGCMLLKRQEFNTV